MNIKNFIKLSVGAFLLTTTSVQAANLFLREDTKSPVLDLPIKVFNVNNKSYIGKDGAVLLYEDIAGGLFYNSNMELAFRNSIFKDNKFESPKGIKGGVLFVESFRAKTGLMNVGFAGNAVISNKLEDAESSGAYGGVAYVAKDADLVFRVGDGLDFLYRGNYASEDGVKKNENGGFLYIDKSVKDDDASMSRVIFNIYADSTLAIGDLHMPDCDSFASKDKSPRIIKIGFGSLTLNSSFEHFLGALYLREGYTDINSSLGVSEFELGNIDKQATSTIRVKEANTFLSKDLAGIIVHEGSVLKFLADEDVLNMEDMTLPLCANADFKITNPERVVTYGADVKDNVLTISALQTLALGGDNFIRLSSYDRVLLKDSINTRKLMLSLSKIGVDSLGLSVSELKEESVEALKQVMAEALGSPKLKFQAYDFKSTYALKDGEKAMLSFYVGDHNLDVSKFSIFKKDKAANKWVLVKVEHLSYNGECLNFEVDELCEYAYVTQGISAL